MARFVIIVFVVAALMGFGVAAATAQDQDEVSCEALTAEEAQAALDENPTYATRFELDLNDDGIACNEEDSGTADDAETEESDTGVGMPGRERTRGAGDAPSAGGTESMPDSGVGTMAGTSSRLFVLTLLGLSGVIATLGLALGRRA